MLSRSKGYITYKARKWVFDFSGIGQAVFLSGTGRGGTTWLSNVINYDNAYRYIFEPFHPAYLPKISHFTDRQYIRPDSRDSIYLRPAKRIIGGKINNRWVNKFNRKILVRRRLIKDIRTNLMLGWLHESFPQIPIVLLLRHPLAVVNSQMANGWSADLRTFLNQPDLMADHLEPYRDLLETTTDNFESLLLHWCIETKVPLHQFRGRNGGTYVVFYENLYSKPEVEIPRLFAFIGRDYDSAVMKTFQLASKTSRMDSPVRKGKNPIYNWQNSISLGQQKYCFDVLRRFDLDHVYGIDPLPKNENSFYNHF
jgi:hypothetical protein